MFLVQLRIAPKTPKPLPNLIINLMLLPILLSFAAASTDCGTYNYPIHLGNADGHSVI